VEKLTKTAQRKNHFLAALAHELRNPLAPIASAAQVLRMKMPHDKDSEWVSDIIERQVVSLKKLVDDLLDIGRISQNQLVLQREKVQLASLLSAAAKEARPAIKKSGHELSLTVPKEPVYLFADSARLIQVFRTLLENSAKIPNSSRRISVVAELEEAGVAVRISDPGAGDPGLGVDLSLVWDLVEMHGGTVEVTSGSSQTGSEFIVHLPIVAQSPVETDVSKSSEPAPSLRILIAEDNPDTAATLAVSLRLDGHSVEIAQDGIEALSIADAFRPQVALLDIGMPGMTGYEVARKIRRMRWGKETLLIAQTGWGRAQDWEKAVESGFNFHLTKPLNYDALTKILDNFRNHLSGMTPDNESSAA
jgi:CheY-like chemotaxis protein/two-component sensor histidine kinase